MRCAPIQAHWLGFCNSTGLDAMDYRLSDDIADPPGIADDASSEEIVRLPEGFFTFLAPEESPPVRPAPSLRNGFITFGCFNNHLKINTGVIDLWAKLMNELPDSRLVLRYGGYKSPHLRRSIIGRFEERGISGRRIRLLESTPAIFQHYDLHGQVDIALDPFPYNGMTTSCDAVWMGVPLVTLRGGPHRSRVGACILTRIGHPEWIAETEEEYVDIAKNLAADPEQLSEIRPGIREAMRESPLMDGPRLARHLEGAYRDWWRRWVRTAPA
jgi:predicted O-linked N-acetylglucosamine transferase (SPINDLY family)